MCWWKNREEKLTFKVEKLHFSNIKFDQISITGTKSEVFSVVNTLLEMAEQYKRVNDLSS